MHQHTPYGKNKPTIEDHFDIDILAKFLARPTIAEFTISLYHLPPENWVPVFCEVWYMPSATCDYV